MIPKKFYIFPAGLSDPELEDFILRRDYKRAAEYATRDQVVYDVELYYLPKKENYVVVETKIDITNRTYHTIINTRTPNAFHAEDKYKELRLGRREKPEEGIDHFEKLDHSHRWEELNKESRPVREALSNLDRGRKLLDLIDSFKGEQ